MNVDTSQVMMTQQSLESKYQRRTLIGCFMGWMFDSQDMVLLSLAIPLIIQDFGLSLTSVAVVATAGLFGTALGAFSWGTISDKIGRKKALLFTLIIFGLFTFLGGFANSVAALAVLRFIAGLGLGGESVIGGTYITETIPPEKRALANGTVQSAFAIGYLLALVVNFYFTALYGWRVLFWSSALVLIAIIYIWWFVPESPAWLRNKENREKGLESITQVTVQGQKWADLFKGANIKATLLASLLCISCLVAYWGSGTWLPTYLSQERGVNVKELTGYLLAINCAAFFGYYFFGWFADKVGRRNSMILGSVASAIVCFAYIQLGTPHTMVVIGAFFGFITYGYWGALATFVSEQFPTTLRGSGLSIAYGSGRLASALSPMILGGIATATSLGFAITLMVIIYLIGAVAAYFMRETKNTIIVD